MNGDRAALRIGIVGCGSAGPAAAALLARAGHKVTLFERAPALRPVGAGFLLQPTGMAVLHELGVLAPILSCGAPVRRLVSVNHRGRRLLDLHYEELAPGLFGVGLHRAVLLEHLVAAARAAGAVIHLGTAVTSLEQTDTAPVVVAADGAKHGPFDLLIVADGARSQLRADWADHARATTYPWGALWFIGPDRSDAFAGQLFQAVRGASTMVGFLPTGSAGPGREALVSLFWSVELSRFEALRAAGLDALKAEILQLVPAARDLLASITSFEQLTLAQYQDVRLRSPHRGRVVFIGDAAHATSPQLGQGVNLALQDALALSRALGTQDTVEGALVHFSRARRRTVSYYQWASRWLTPLFQSRTRLAGC